MKGLRELLADAVPEPPAVDRVAEAGRRVRRRRRVRGAVASGLVLVLTAGALVGTQWFGSGREESPVASPPPVTTTVPVLDCPAAPGMRVRRQGPGGPVAVESAVNALVCVYGQSRVIYQAEIRHGVAAVVRAMNGLPAEHTSTPGVQDACTLIGRASYVIVLGYPDGTRHDVGIDLNCGTLFRDDLIRFGDITRPLDEFAAIVRADGREFPYPHVDRW